jgi:hypothetical protein
VEESLSKSNMKTSASSDFFTEDYMEDDPSSVINIFANRCSGNEDLTLAPKVLKTPRKGNWVDESKPKVRPISKHKRGKVDNSQSI